MRLSDGVAKAGIVQAESAWRRSRERFLARARLIESRHNSCIATTSASKGLMLLGFSGSISSFLNW